MAEERVEIVTLNIEADKAIKDLAESQKAAKKLRDEIKELSKAEGDNSLEVAKKTAELKNVQAEMRVNTNTAKALLKVEKEQTGSINEMRAELTKVSAEWAALSKKERENESIGGKLAKKKLDLTNALKAEGKATGDARMYVGSYTDSIKEALSGTSLFSPAIGKATGGVQMFGTAFKTALGPIGLVVAIIGAIVAAVNSFFKSSEEGQASLRRLQAIFSGVFGVMNDLLSDVGEAIVWIFENPKKAISDFAKLIKENIINRFNGLLELLPALGKAIGLLFKGEFSEAGKVAGDAVAKVALGVENFTDKVVDGFNKAVDGVNEFTKKAVEAAKIAQQLADQETALIKLRRESRLETAKNKDAIQDLLLLSRDETKSAEERREAIQKANELSLRDLELKEEVLKKNYELIKAQSSLSKSTEEDMDKLYDAEVALYEMRAQNSAVRRQLLNRENTLIREIAAEQEAIRKKEAEDALAALNAEIEAELEKQRRLDEIDEQRRLNKEEARQIDLENEYIVEQDNLFRMLELEREALEEKRQQEIEFALKIGADTTLINKKYSKAKQELDKAEFEAKMALASSFANDIAQIAGENTKVGKAAAVAQTTISTFQAAQGAFASLSPIPIVGPELGAVAAGAAVAMGVKNVKSILKTKSGLPGESGGGAPSINADVASVPNQAIRAEGEAPELNEGIVSRDTIRDEGVQGGGYIPVLVSDEVTAKQNETSRNQLTSVV